MAKRGRPKGSKPTGKQKETVFKPGNRANPTGRSTAHQKMQVAFEETMQEFLSEEVMVKKDKKNVKMTRLKMVLHQLFKEAIEGKSKVAATTEIFDRAFGKARQAIDHTGIAPVTIIDDVPEYPLPEIPVPQDDDAAPVAEGVEEAPADGAS